MLALTTLPSLILAVVFAVSGVGKLLDLGAASSTLRALRITGLPAGPTVGAVAAAELVTALGLLLGAGPTAVAAAAGALTLTLVFLAIGVRAQARASTDDCGCFGRVASTRVGPAMTARNAALSALAALSLLGALEEPALPALAVRLLLSPLPAIGALLSAVAVAVVVASLRRPEAPNRTGVPDAALIAPEGEVVVPRQRALRGRAQLLLFVRRGCSACESLIDRMTGDRDRLETLVDVRLIVAVGDGSPLSSADVGLHADPSGEFAVALGIPADRPAGVLLTTSGGLLRPIAVGGEETASLVDTVLAAAADARTPRSDEDRSTH
ncbi:MULTISPECIES: MauE/DoxX family redox-associated membrane protein [Microbacterium]|jgi:uncharacterized membrane protein YphA (DoxX/SURF4 family)|uniref:MauE/DoxX family redox-associated membrane protein n=1 Tax=Microbacterium TaxID=33882 RepID=UPI001D175FA6|nr:MauE/DoxX family redox-associated membrane protein [Microbacterium testaceum]MCC4247463.1 hypothetical protein [Microbacterium testaceum]